jgi:hypothetical protein
MTTKFKMPSFKSLRGSRRDASISEAGDAPGPAVPLAEGPAGGAVIAKRPPPFVGSDAERKARIDQIVAKAMTAKGVRTPAIMPSAPTAAGKAPPSAAARELTARPEEAKDRPPATVKKTAARKKSAPAPLASPAPAAENKARAPRAPAASPAAAKKRAAPPSPAHAPTPATPAAKATRKKAAPAPRVPGAKKAAAPAAKAVAPKKKAAPRKTAATKK